MKISQLLSMHQESNAMSYKERVSSWSQYCCWCCREGKREKKGKWKMRKKHPDREQQQKERQEIPGESRVSLAFIPSFVFATHEKKVYTRPPTGIAGIFHASRESVCDSRQERERSTDTSQRKEGRERERKDQTDKTNIPGINSGKPASSSLFSLSHSWLQAAWFLFEWLAFFQLHLPFLSFPGTLKETGEEKEKERENNDPVLMEHDPRQTLHNFCPQR